MTSCIERSGRFLAEVIRHPRQLAWRERREARRAVFSPPDCLRLQAIARFPASRSVGSPVTFRAEPRMRHNIATLSGTFCVEVFAPLKSLDSGNLRRESSRRAAYRVIPTETGVISKWGRGAPITKSPALAGA